MYLSIRMDGLTMNDTSTAQPSRNGVFEHLSALGDPIRCRLLLLLEERELAVGELCDILQLPQSTVSRHLKVLLDDRWIAARRDGTSRRYSGALPTDEGARRLWSAVREEVASGRTAAEDLRRLEGVLAQRRTRSQEFFSTAAGDWAGMRGELFGRRFDLLALLGLLDDRWVVGDLGCGTGQLAWSLSPYVRRVVGVDESDQMLDAARKRLEGMGNVMLRRGLLEDLPLADEELDAALLVLVLHHLGDPAVALVEAVRCLRPGGRLLVVDMLPHDREEYRQQMGHVWLGFEPERITSWLHEAGLEAAHVLPLAADPDAKGPGLFAASARKPTRDITRRGRPRMTDPD